MLYKIARFIGTIYGNRLAAQDRAEFARRDADRADKLAEYRRRLAQLPHDVPHHAAKANVARVRRDVYGW